MSIKFLVLGGGGGYFGFWGGECRFYFYGREDFSELRRYVHSKQDIKEGIGMKMHVLGGCQQRCGMSA